MPLPVQWDVWYFFPSTLLVILCSLVSRASRVCNGLALLFGLMIVSSETRCRHLWSTSTRHGTFQEHDVSALASSQSVQCCNIGNRWRTIRDADSNVCKPKSRTSHFSSQNTSALRSLVFNSYLQSFSGDIDFFSDLSTVQRQQFCNAFTLNQPCLFTLQYLYQTLW